jgi:hypothetical protein
MGAIRCRLPLAALKTGKRWDWRTVRVDLDNGACIRDQEKWPMCPWLWMALTVQATC